MSAARDVLEEALLLDSEGLSKAGQADPLVRALLELAVQRGADVLVSAVTLAETLRGHRRDAGVYRVLKACSLRPVTPDIGRRAGEILGAVGRSDTVDAVIAATASQHSGPVRIITSDVRDLSGLTQDLPNVSVTLV